MPEHNTDKDVPDPMERDVQEAVSILQAPGELTPLMLKFHLITENLLERLIVAHLPGGYGLLERGNLNLSYRHKLEVVHSFRIVEEKGIEALRRLNKVRNTLSHSKDAAASRHDIESIGFPFGKAFAQIRKMHEHDLTSLATCTFGMIFGVILPAVHKEEELPRRAS